MVIAKDIKLLAPFWSLDSVASPCMQASRVVWFLTRLPLTQVDPDKYKSIGNGFRLTVREDGARGLAKGWAPTFIGYSMQGLCKFGFYEVFKIFYSDLMGEVRTPSSRSPGQHC